MYRLRSIHDSVFCSTVFCVILAVVSVTYPVGGKNMKISEITKCASCDLLQYCGGGCRLECQTLEDKDDNVCETFRVFKDKILPILQSLGIQFLV